VAIFSAQRGIAKLTINHRYDFSPSYHHLHKSKFSFLFCVSAKCQRDKVIAAIQLFCLTVHEEGAAMTAHGSL
jgi:hypothetical protein